MSEGAVRIGIIGVGRLGSCLAAGLVRHGYCVSGVYRRDVTAARAVAEELGTVALEEPQAVVDGADVVFVTTPDRAISRVAGSVVFRPGQAVVHCSGATPVTALASAAGAGARCGSFHPLQTFPESLQSGRLTGITFAVGTEDTALREWLVGVATSCGSTTVEVPEDARALYHASAAMVSPLAMGLVGLAARLWEEWGATHSDGVQALTPLAESTLESLRTTPFPGAMTGPYARGDVEVIRAHLSALAGVPPDVGQAYAALALAALPFASRAGQVDEDVISEIRDALTEFLKGRS